MAIERLLRVYAEGRNGSWEAVCLDLDLAVQGSSLSEALETLKKSIILYFEEVNSLPESERARLLSRRAPFAMRMKFAWCLARMLFAAPKRDGGLRDGEVVERWEGMVPVPA